MTMNNYTENDVTVHAAVCYINTKELMMDDRPQLLRMMLHCLRIKNRMRLLHYEYGYLSDHDQTSTSSCFGISIYCEKFQGWMRRTF